MKQTNTQQSEKTSVFGMFIQNYTFFGTALGIIIDYFLVA